MFGEPPQTAWDLHFNLFGFHVRIHPLFWLVLLLLQLSSPPIVVALWVVAALVSLLVHELGHALMFRRFGRHSHIVLYAFGGLTIPEGGFSRPQTTAKRILISLAGPAAGFLFAAILVLTLYLSGFDASFESSLLRWDLPGKLIRDPRLQLLVGMLLEVNIYWGLFNLLPIFPLDGGQVVREVLQATNPRQGFEQALRLSMLAAGGFAALVLVRYNDLYLGLMFGYMAYLNYQLLRASGGGGW